QASQWEIRESRRKEWEESLSLLKENADPEFEEEIRQEIARNEEAFHAAERSLRSLLIPADPLDNSPLMMEIRAGTGGEEAALFVADCCRMYRLYADAQGWEIALLSSSPSSAGGYKEAILSVSGKQAHRLLQYEGGTHRVQRVPTTETQGRVHTSAITIAVLAEEEGDEVTIETKDLQIDTYRASGAGGQHVNTTDSAVRITHLPTGTVVACQQERSQIKNRAHALRILKAKIAEHVRREAEVAHNKLRKDQMGSGDRSDRIRTYNFPQNRLTDHRLAKTYYNLDRRMEGELLDLSEALVQHFAEFAE
ncbi:MAG: peptide chain release factor 1, partial [Chlamydiota bacterium]|nr:peptide chain release factor 1 [Chlamydiota bacterium]